MAVPTTTKVWTVAGKGSFDVLKFSEQVLAPPGDKEVLVKLEAASLNYRDLIIPLGKYPFPFAEGVVPGSDGAGTVVSVGKHVRKWKVGDKVVTLFNQSHLGGPITAADAGTGLGGALDGTLRQYGAFDENGLVAMPPNLSFIEASTLSCAGVTAWNAFYGLAGREVKPGDWVLTQGTGGVSIFAVQFAKAAGAKVVATTSSDEKAKLLQKLGADHIINYKETPEWGAAAKKLTPNERGFNHIVEVAGPASMQQSLNAVGMEGIITIIGFVGGTGGGKEPGFINCLTHLCTTRGVFVGSRVQMEDMCHAIEANPEVLRPVVDGKIFKLEQLKEAFEYVWSQKHQGKVVIDIE